MATQRLDPHATCVPAAIRAAALARWQPGASLWRCSEADTARDLWAAYGCGTRAGGVQWQLRSADGALLAVFWQE